MLLFGGQRGTGYENDVWIYDLSDNTWTEQSPSGDKPTARVHYGITYIGNAQVLLFGGYGPGYNNDTWVYDLCDNSWTEDTNTTKPSGRYAELAMTSLDGSDYPVLFGGYTPAYQNDTWAFGGGDLPMTGTDPIPEIDVQRPASTSIADGAADGIGGHDVGTVNLTYTYRQHRRRGPA